MTVARDDLRAQGERDLERILRAEPDVRFAIDALAEERGKAGARHHLLGSAMRLTQEMAPGVHRTVDDCRKTLGIEGSVEVYVYADPRFNAAAVAPENGRLFMMLSASLLEAFTPAELSFVVGHELGHHLFGHHDIPVGLLLRGRGPRRPGVVLQLFAWQRYAEISADRAGLVCATTLEPAATALFKLASGLRGGQIEVRIDQFLLQVGDLREEAGRLAGGDEAARTDWFATHPFSPLRLKAVELFSTSELATTGGTSRVELEAQVHDLMLLMEPSYLSERSDVAETMRRLLLAGGVAVAAASGELEDRALDELARLMGAGALPSEIKPQLLRSALPARMDDVKASVPALRRAQVVRDLCVIARADGTVSESELAVIREIARGIDVDISLVDRCVRSEGASSCEA